MEGRAVRRGGDAAVARIGALQADPLAVFRMAPLLNLAKAVRSGWASEDDAQLLSEGPPGHPLANALRRSMSLTGNFLAWEAELLAGHLGGRWGVLGSRLADTRLWLCSRLPMLWRDLR